MRFGPLGVAGVGVWAAVVLCAWQVFLYGLVPLDYAALFAAVGLVSTVLGQTVVEGLVRKYQQDAVVVLVIGAVMVVAMGLMAAVGLLNVANGAPFTFGSLCGCEQIGGGFAKKQQMANANNAWAMKPAACL